jgi:hypothetical protein
MASNRRNRQARLKRALDHGQRKRGLGRKTGPGRHMVGVPAAPAKNGLLAPAAFARIQPVLHRPQKSIKPALTATRSCVNNARMRAFTSRSNDAQSSSALDRCTCHP